MLHSKVTCYIALLIAFFILSSHLFSQITYHRYLDSTYYWSEWENSYYFGGPGTPCVSGGNYITQKLFHIAGEEEINGEWWYTIHQDYQSTLYCGTGGSFPEPARGDSAIRLWIREDSSGKIWGVQPSFPPVVLFDFSGPLGVGDTLWMNDYQQYCPIASIDSISIGSRRRARYHCGCDSLQPPTVPSYVIEGAGLNESILGFNDICADIFDVSFITTCIGFGAEFYTLDNTYPCGAPGHISVGIDRPILLNLDLRWNPQAHRVSLFSGLQGRILDWQLVDLSGRVLLGGRLEAAELPLEGLSQGVYILQIREGDAFQTWKLPYF